MSCYPVLGYKTRHMRLVKLFQYYTALVLDSDPTDKCSACKHLIKKQKLPLIENTTKPKTKRLIKTQAVTLHWKIFSKHKHALQKHSTFLERSLILPPPHT